MIDLISLIFLVSGTILLTITLIFLIILIRKYWGKWKRVSKEDILLFSCYGMRGEGKSYYEKMKEKDKEIERLNNIINEAIEYIESYMPNYDFDKTNLIKLLEILDKENK